MADLEFVTPKTDWVASDFINMVDFNRIVNNIYFLKDYCRSLYKVKYPDEMQYCQSKKDFPYYTMLNAIENDLDALNLASYSLDIGQKSTYYIQGKGFTFDELNRLESAILELYEHIKNDRHNIPTLSFVLGEIGGL